MQIQPIQTALKHKLNSVVLLDKEVSLDTNSGIFVTMNPAGKGYGGRQKLPDNLKQLFRPVVMSTPDSQVIAEVYLFAEGFKEAEDIAGKLVGLFKVSKQLLSNQQHYDWGLRSIIPVLKSCGSMLRKMKSNKDFVSDIQSESEIVVNSLRVNIISRLTFFDNLKFDEILRDTFPNIDFNNAGYEQLEEALRSSFVDLGLESNETQVRKGVELFEQLKQRMGVNIVGPSGSGKTTMTHLLKHALGKLGQKIKQHTINPKAIPRSQLLGHIDLDTREWTNGVLTIAALHAVEEPEDVTTWIICDGDVDPEWVESLNSVLDENRLLTLPSGWRIQFGPNTNFIFETHDLTHASPATVSRMAMIFLSDEDTNITGLVNSWIQKQDDDKRENLLKYIQELFFNAVDWCVKANDMVIETSLVGLVLNGLSQLENANNRLEFAVGLIKGLGGNLNSTSRNNFAQEVLKWIGESSPGKNPINVFYNKNRDRLETYSNEVEGDFSASNLSIESMPIVATANVQMTMDTVMPWLTSKTKKPFLLIGPEGIGKTMILHHCFSKLRSTNVATIHCSANINPQNVIQKLSQVCLTVSSSNGRIFAPKECDRLILFFKDLNLAKPDKYGTSMLIAFLQQLITYNGFYDNNNEWIGLQDIQLVGCMTGGSGLGRHPLSTRFSSIIRIFSINEPDKEQLEVIYSSYLYTVLKEIVPGHPIWANPGKVSGLSSSMVNLYHQMKSSFSVDDNNHYLFTPRDLSRWCIGMMRYKLEDNDKSQNSILHVWAYECARLFRDKLVNDRDAGKFDSLLNSILQSGWNSNVGNQLQNSYFVTSGAAESSGGKLPSFGKSLGQLAIKDWISYVDKGKAVFARENWTLNHFTTQELLDMCARIDRAVSSPRGSILLAGRSGVGRREATCTVAAMHDAKLVTLKMGKNFGIKQFKTELKAVMQLAGVEEEQIFLLLEDQNFVNDELLDLVNSLLSSGEIPGLYSPEEMEPLLTPLKQNATNAGYTGDAISYFAKNVRKNLHIVLIMDCSSPEFVIKCESNPAFYKECTILWNYDFSPETYMTVPISILNQIKESEIDKKESKSLQRQTSINDRLASSFYEMHKSIEPKHATPEKFITMVNSYEDVYENKKQKILERKDKLSKGVSKLKEAREVVAKLKKEAAAQEEILAEKQGEANQALQMITDTMKNANTQKSEMQDLKSNTMKEEKSIAERKKVIDEELKEVEPLIEEAKRAVGNIKSETLTEIRSLRVPPDVIRDILEATLLLMGTEDTSWNSMKSFLAKRGVKEEIRSFDARRINPKNRQAVEKLLQSRGASFDEKAAKRASNAALPIAQWVLANVKYSYVLEKIKPLEQEQNKLHNNLKMAEEQLHGLTKGLDEVDAKVAVLKQKLNQFTREAAEVEISLAKTKETISSADQLVAGLEGEYQRWNKEVDSMGHDIESLPSYAIMAAGFLTYLSDLSEDMRKTLIDRWSTKLGVKKFDIKRFLSSEREMLQWRADGLPADELSLENAIAIMKCSKKPFIIDPSSQATEWLKVHFGKEDNLEITNVNDERFFLNLELAVRFGKTLLVLDIHKIEPVLYPLLRKEVVGQGPYKTIQVGDKQIDYNPNFKLFLVTKDPNIEIAVDSKSLVTLINFTTTSAGLTGQLLGKALHVEKPELEQRKSELLKQEEDLKIQISNLEDALLDQLSASSGNILENKELLDSLNQTKTKSANIETSLKESVTLQANLEKEGNTYLPIAEFASKFFFVIKELSKINIMYQFSQSSFVALYEKTLSSSASKNENRIKDLMRSLLHIVYEYITRSLFKEDRLMFALHLAHGMFGDLFLPNEWELFTGMLIDGNSQESSSSVPDWIGEERKPDTSKLVKSFPDIARALELDNQNSWASFMKQEDCEQEFPGHVSKKISLFQQLLTIQALRPDRLQSAMEFFALKVLGLKELSPPALTLKSILKETIAEEPVLMLISPGTDPSQELRDLASKVRQTLHEVALGQGQAEAAVEKLRDSMKHGQWLILKNLHLMTFWIPILSKEIQSTKPHEDFRLWLTAEPHPKFPSLLSESCLKITYESPPGIKRNLQTTINTWSNDVFNRDNNVIRAQTLFSLAWFHAIVQERRTFIPQGWASNYEFSDGDLRSGLEVIENLFETKDSSIDWNFIHGLFKNAIYGGRVDNVYDLRILDSYLEEIFNNDVIGGTNRNKKDIAPGIEVPRSTSYQDYVEEVHKMPDEDKPIYFGLPANINRSHQRNVSSQVISKLKLLMISFGVASRFDREKWQAELSPILNLWKKLNQGSSMLQLKLQFPQGDPSNPIKSFVQLEQFNGVSLLQNIHKSLAGLSKVIRGSSLLDEKVSKLAASLLQQETPAIWHKLWAGPENPMDYIKTIVYKAGEIRKWSSRMDQGSLLKENLDLADLFNPDTFLSALAQQSAREYNVSMTSLKLASSWSRGGVSGAKVSIKVGSLQLEGANFDGVRLTDSGHDSPSIQAAPVCTFAWVPENDSQHTGEMMSVPLYWTRDRERLLAMVDLPSGGEEYKWLKSGVVLFLRNVA